MTVGVLDANIGNIQNVCNAVEVVGFDFSIVHNSSELDNVSHLILPGVGSFSAAMANLDRAGLVSGLQQYVSSGRPLLGICLGMQILAESGEEGGFTNGLGLIPGRVVRLPETKACLVPHVGWNSVVFTRSHPVTRKIKPQVDFYFVHSYYMVCDSENDILGKTDHSTSFTSAVARNNVVGVQFHPEKSQESGLRLIENFCDWNGRC